MYSTPYLAITKKTDDRRENPHHGAHKKVNLFHNGQGFSKLSSKLLKTLVMMGSIRLIWDVFLTPGRHIIMEVFETERKYLITASLLSVESPNHLASHSGTFLWMLVLMRNQSAVVPTCCPRDTQAGHRPGPQRLTVPPLRVRTGRRTRWRRWSGTTASTTRTTVATSPRRRWTTSSASGCPRFPQNSWRPGGGPLRPPPWGRVEPALGWAGGKFSLFAQAGVTMDPEAQIGVFKGS